MVASQTLHPIPKLSLEIIHNQAIISHPIYFPLLLARDLLRQFFELCFAFGGRFVVRFRNYTIEVFVKAIQEERQKLLRVMLVWTTKLGRVVTYRFLCGSIIWVPDQIGKKINVLGT